MKELVAFGTALSMLAGAAFAQSVSVDGDGWISVDGNTVGRVWYSWSYQMVCSNGYVNKPSDDMLRQLNSMDEAIGLLLQSCQR